MPRPRPPWWMYLLAASFSGFVILFAYVLFWGPEYLGIGGEYREGGMYLTAVHQDSPAMRAGLQAGDIIVAVDGQVIAGRYDWSSARQNFEIGRPLRLQVRRGAELLEVSVMLGHQKALWSAVELANVVIMAAFVLMLLLGLLIAFQRPQDTMARIAALYMGNMAVFGALVLPPGFSASWRQLPLLLGALLWIARVSSTLIGPVTFTFASLFPQKLPLPRWLWVTAWVPALLLSPLILFHQFHMVYRPGLVTSPWVARALGMEWILLACYGLAAFVLFGINYRRLEDPNQKRRVRLLFLGAIVGLTPGFPWFVAMALGPTSALARFFLSDLYLSVIGFLSAVFPITYAYVVLRHRLFDIRVMIRQGLQYALARRLLLSVVPVLAAVLLLDLLLHGDQPLLSILKSRGWVYVFLGGLALVAHAKRAAWLDGLDRRFFRESYDARRLLREVVEVIREARSLESVAPRVVAHIEAALHPEFAALLVHEPKETSYRVLAAAPASHAPPALPAQSKLAALVRLLGKPLEVPRTESGWLQQQLPHKETDFLRCARLDLLVPVSTDAERTEVLLALGAKRSEEPYSREDQDLLLAIASSLALLLEKPATQPATFGNAFEECPQCGLTYDTGSGRCGQDGSALGLVALPRLLADRYHLERRLGRGGMGTVYAATDAALERRVAVKVIRDDLVGSAEAADRFRREAKTAAGFAHPNVVTVHDFGVAGARAFLVMELLEGRSLREEVRHGGRLPAARVLEILRGVCAAVDAAHQRNLIHRDLKPENIFLARGIAGEAAKVLDFGIAKFLPSDTLVTQDADTGAGVLMGTIRYMSPEQLRGGAVDPSWDLWALAVVAYEMLAGAHPFPTGNSLEFQHAVLAGQNTPIRTHVPEASAAWDDFFTKVLAPAIGRRPSTARALFAELQAALG